MSDFSMASVLPSSLWEEGLTSGSLQELLTSIDRTTEQVRYAIYHQLGARTQNADTDLDKDILESMVSIAKAPNPQSGPEQYLEEYARKYMEIQAYVESLQVQLKATQATADLEATLREFQGFLENGQYESAAYNLVQQKKILEETRQISSAGALVVQLEQAWQRCVGELDEALESCCREAVDVPAEGGVMTITSSLPSGGDIGELWSAMLVAGLLEKHLRWFSDTLLWQVLPPVLAGTALLHAHTTPGDESAIVNWSSAPSPEQTQTAIVEKRCIQLMQVLAQSLFRSQEAILAEFGKVFWPGFVQRYKETFLEQASHCKASVLHARQEGAREMEGAAISLGLAPADSELGTMLSRAIQQSYHVHQQQYLSRVRELLLAHDPHEPPVAVGAPLPLDVGFYERWRKGEVKAWELLDPPSGWDQQGPVLAAGYYQITPTVIQVAAVMDDAVADACSSGDTAMAQAVVVALPKVSAMYSTMVAAPAAADAPQLALLRHNDLHYLANHLLLLPYLFSPQLEGLVGSEVWLGDEAARLRAAARACFNDALAVQQAALREALSALRDLSSLSRKTGAESISQRKAVRQLLHTLNRAGRLVWPTLTPAAALDFSARLLGPVFQALLGDILAKQDIGVQECNEIVQLFRPLVDEAVAELLNGVDVSAQTSAIRDLDVKQLLAEAVTQRTWGLRKLSAVLNLMDAKLVDVVRLWEEGAFSREGLCFGEVERLVCALFEDTDYRAQCLQKMEVADVEAQQAGGQQHSRR